MTFDARRFRDGPSRRRRMIDPGTNRVDAMHDFRADRRRSNSIAFLRLLHLAPMALIRQSVGRLVGRNDRVASLLSWQQQS